MVKIVPKSKKDIEKALVRCGFKLEKKRDHNYYFLYVDNKKTKINTKVSHGSYKDISDGLLNQMMKQIKLSKKDFNRLIEGKLSKDEYISYLRDIGEID